ncbi:MAG: malto-oligosyltrehalose trehalohydrolase [Alphaproteobacteria bacterium]|nr:malto-oligosyltrehalose trehalohydrolase [Alphaproteobacteria bacterium]
MIPELQFGAKLHADGVAFRLWAPGARRVEVMLDRAHPMEKQPHGWYAANVPGLRAGALYKFRIDGETEVADPASCFQPQDVHGPSEIIDHAAFAWHTPQWRGRPWGEAVILEIHVGAFTPDGTFRAAIERLDALVDVGVTAIELMPLADTAGGRNWGYDGVLLFAPDSCYGRPDDLRALVDAAHARGLMVLLDVVYNHLGPEGNDLARYAPAFFAPAQTPWGAAIDYRVPQVRAFAVENALHWLARYRFDGLRLDAVHAITEPGEPSILEELSRVVGAFAAASGRRIHLVLENDANRASLLDPEAEVPAGKYRAQWNDDHHHAWHVLLTGETAGHYQDYAADPRRAIARVLASGFAFQGEASAHRGGRGRGEASDHLPPFAFVNFLQNHDQIGNRPLGDRLTTQVGSAPLAAALAVLLLLPMPPLLFMGEEWGSRRPFPFFCDLPEPLATAVRKGRRAEFRAAYAALGDEIPDPLAEDTFRSAVLDWEARDAPEGRERLALVRDLIAVRRREIVPELSFARFGSAQWCGDVLTAHWGLNPGRALLLVANLSDRAADRPRHFHCGRPIWGGAAPARLTPWSVHWSIGAP